MNFIKHFFKRHLCVDNIYIGDGGGGLTPALMCKDCNREIGFIYSDGIEWKAFIHVGFRRYKLEIERWVYEHTKDRNHMGNTFKQEWGEVLHNLKQWHENGVLSVGCEEWDGECEEDSEGNKSDGVGEEHEDVNTIFFKQQKIERGQYYDEKSKD